MISTRTRDLAIATAVLLAAFAYFARHVHLTFDMRDEGYLYVTIERVAAGEVPHRDFIGLYGPGVYAVNVPVFRGFGGEILPVRRFLAGVRAVAVLLVYLLARRLVPLPFALLAAFLATAWWGRVIWTLNSPYAAIFTIPLGLAATLLVIRAGARDDPRWLLLAGLASGAALVFKQSLASVIAYGLTLAICAGVMLEPARSERPGRGRVAILAAWAAAGALLVAPFLSTLRPLDYALHFLPVHALLALIGVRFARHGDGPAFLRRALPRAGLFVAGFCVVPALVAALYAWWGALGELAYDMFVRPLDLQNYHQSVDLPVYDTITATLAIGGLSFAGLAWLGRARRAAGALLAIGLGAGVLLVPRLESFSQFGILMVQLNGVLGVLIAGAALVLLARALAAPDPRRAEPVLAALIPALFFQLMLAFQIFPRGKWVVTIMLGALAPVGVYLLHRGYRFAVAGASSAGVARRAAAFALVSLLPLSLTSYLVLNTVMTRTAAQLARSEMSLPGARGIRLAPFEYHLQDVRVVEWLVDHIKRLEPEDAPLFLLTNERMLQFLSRRDSLFPEFTFLFYLVGFDMLPPEGRRELDPELIVERLAAHPETILVEKDDDSTAQLRAYLPELDRYVRDHYEVEYRVGLYRVLRRKPLDLAVSASPAGGR